MFSFRIFVSFKNENNNNNKNNRNKNNSNYTTNTTSNNNNYNNNNINIRFVTSIYLCASSVAHNTVKVKYYETKTNQLNRKKSFIDLIRIKKTHFPIFIVSKALCFFLFLYIKSVESPKNIV